MPSVAEAQRHRRHRHPVEMEVGARAAVRRVAAAARLGTAGCQAAGAAASGWVAAAVLETVGAWATVGLVRAGVAAVERAKGLEQVLRHHRRASSERWWRKRCPPERCHW